MDAKKVEAMPCPSCGRKSLHYFEDKLSAGAQCWEHDCLSFFDIGELIEESECRQVGVL